jgi:MFS family permease
MAKREKDRLYYEITKEKPLGVFQMLVVAGTIGSVMGFLIASLIGIYDGMELDTLVLTFLIATFLGFLFGALVMWFFLHHFEKLIAKVPLTSESPSVAPSEQTSEPVATVEAGPVVENDEAKGKSVDFVFPELSPDKQ